MKALHFTKLVKVGTSLGVVIPSNVVRALGWERGDILVFGFAGTDQLVIKRVTDVEFQELKAETEVIDIS